MTTHIGSRQDGESPERRSDSLAERARPGLHGAGRPGKARQSPDEAPDPGPAPDPADVRPKNREVENDMVGAQPMDGEPPLPATEQPAGNPAKAAGSTGER